MHRRVLAMCTQPIVAIGLRALGAERDDMVIDVGEARDLYTAAEPYDVVLYDVVRCYADSARELHEIVTLSRAAVVALTHDLRPDLTERVLERGVHGVVSVHASAAEILDAVGSARRSEPLSGDDVPGAQDDELARLAPREREMLELIAAGLSNQEIAERLFLSINSVKTYIRTAYRKIGAASRSQAVVWAMWHGLGPAPDVDVASVTSAEA